MNPRLHQIRSAILGFAVGDALGVPVEFSAREELDRDPVTEMRGYGTYPYPAGTWSDDTSMTLAALDSLADGLDFEDMMTRFVRWYKKADYTPAGVMFDIGGTTRHALERSLRGTPALSCGLTGGRDNGNGSLMRILPAVLWLNLSEKKSLPLADRLDLVHKISSLTHAHLRSQLGCGIYAIVAARLLEQPSKEAVREGITEAAAFYRDHAEAAAYARILRGGIADLPRGEISGSGYVVHCLEAALWCLLNTDSYRDCVLAAVNLGDDTDTTAAVAGGLAGLLYGLEAIPADWLALLLRRELIETLCEQADTRWR